MGTKFKTDPYMASFLQSPKMFFYSLHDIYADYFCSDLLLLLGLLQNKKKYCHTSSLLKIKCVQSCCF